ncbi:MAG: lysylphosphatidylglycerol synthase transmembrane domain-containing protein [Usitatibacter sp.]
MKEPRNLRRIAIFVLEYLVGAAILYWLFHRELLDLSPLRTVSLPLAAGGIALSLLMLYLASLRVRLLLSEQGIALSVARCFLFNCLGIFYSLFLPGGISGDAARAYYLVREVGHTRAALVGSLILDRVLGLLAMIGLGTVSSAFLVSSLPWLLPYFIALCVLFLGGVAFVAYLFMADVKPASGRERNFVVRAYEVAHNFLVRLNISGHSKRTLAYAAGLSVVIHSLSIFLIYVCARHASSGLGLLGVFSVGPFGLLANAIPISPGGLGVGEQSFEFLFRLAGAKNGASSFLMARVFFYCPALIGAGVAAVYFLRLHHLVKLARSRPAPEARRDESA